MDNGYIFSNKKKGNFYQISDMVKYATNKVENTTNNGIAIISLTLDTESKHYESKVFNLMDSIGTIGGIYEITLSMVLIIYTGIRKNLYYRSIINELNKQMKKNSFEDSKNFGDGTHQAHNIN